MAICLFVLYRVLLFYFAKVLCLQRDLWKGPDTYSGIQISDDFEIVLLDNWIGISRSLMEKLYSKSTKIDNMRLNELMAMIIVFSVSV